MSDTDQYSYIGQVLKSNGSDGQTVISLDSNADYANFEEEPVFIFFDGLPVPYFVDVKSERGTNKVIASLTDIRSQKDAEELSGRKIYIKNTDACGDGGRDFEGWTLWDRDTAIGEITGIEDIPGNPCLEVEISGRTGAKASQTVLVPFNEDLLIEADADMKILRMALPEGLV